MSDVPDAAAAQVFAVLCLGVLALTAATPIPAMSDYLNHLRMHLLAGDASPYYAVDWRFYPDLAMDLIVPGSRAGPASRRAARLFVLVAQALMLSGPWPSNAR